jgi:ATP phosphoribosyltransferase regulatory subunit
MTNRWLLPENISDVLPSEAFKVEYLRGTLLGVFKSYGYQLTIPPMLEYLESLLTAGGSDMNLQIFKLIDQLSGRTLGLRTDMTTQIARIDAHILNQTGVSRLCYAGTTLQTKVVPGIFSREQLQIGVEIYGHPGIEADIEILSLMLDALNCANVGTITLDLSHAGILKAILEDVAMSTEDVQSLHGALQAKNKKLLSTLCANWSEEKFKTLHSLLELSGEAFKVIAQAREVLPNTSIFNDAINALEQFCQIIHLIRPETQLNIDLADLDGFQYHTGLMCAAYVDNYPVAIARGGRYDQVGSAFGRDRAATGFSLDLFALSNVSKLDFALRAISAPWDNRQDLRDAISELRKSGEVVIQNFSEEPHSESIYEFDRKLILEGSHWKVVSV